MLLPNGLRRRLTGLENELARVEALKRAPESVLRHLAMAREDAGPFEKRGSLNTWQETLYSSIVTETALTAAAEAVVFPASTAPGYYGSIPGGYMVEGRTLKLRVAGQTSTAATPGTFTERIRWGGVGGTVLAASAAVTMAASQTNITWWAEWYITCRLRGATGSLLCTGTVNSAAIPTPFRFEMPASAPAAVTVTTVATTDLAFTHSPSLSTASLGGFQYTLTSLN